MSRLHDSSQLFPLRNPISFHSGDHGHVDDVQSENETALLLVQQRASKDFHPSQRSETPLSKASTFSWQYVIALCGIAVIVIDVGGYLAVTPQTRLYESIICSQYYGREGTPQFGDGGSIPEKYCKIQAIQTELAMILGWQACFDNIPGILLVVPYCSLADKYGRKWFLILSLNGIALSMVWILFVVRITRLEIILWRAMNFEISQI